MKITSIPRLSEVAETGLEIVAHAEVEATNPDDCNLSHEDDGNVDADESFNLSRNVDSISGTLAAAMRYFAVRLESAEDIVSKVLDSADSSLVLPQEMRKTISAALRFSDITLPPTFFNALSDTLQY